MVRGLGRDDEVLVVGVVGGGCGGRGLGRRERWCSGGAAQRDHGRVFWCEKAQVVWVVVGGGVEREARAGRSGGGGRGRD